MFYVLTVQVHVLLRHLVQHRREYNSNLITVASHYTRFRYPRFHFGIMAKFPDLFLTRDSPASLPDGSGC
jgi:hypothetical protein